MTDTTTAWPPDAGSPTIPDPGLTLSEALNVFGVLNYFIGNSRAEGDAVLESAMEKLMECSRATAQGRPEAYELVQLEIEMQKRFGLGG